jgi:putative oxidoreductase
MIALPSFTKPLVRLADSLRWLGPLVLRLVVGTVFIYSGWGKLNNLERTIAYFDSLGVPAASLQAPMVAGIEFVGGILLIFGLCTRIAAALLIGVMAVALLTAIAPEAESFSAIIGSIESAYLAVFVYLATNGGGAASVDHRLWTRAE